MPNNDREIVTAIRRRLAERVGQERFELWFGTNVHLRHEGGKVYVEAGDTFTVERLRRQMRGEIIAAAEDVLGDDVSVVFAVDKTRPTSSPAETALPEVGSGASQSSLSSKPVLPPNASQTDPTTRAYSKRCLNDFIVGDCNRLAFTAAQQVPRRLGVVSPVLIHGPTGCGKTHLLEGIATVTRRLPGRRRVVNLSAEQFTSYFLEALKGSGLPSFRRKYRDVDLLLIDDVQFFVGKRATLVELQHTIDTMLRNGKQLVLAADRPPAEMRALGLEITARMTGGLVCNIEPADEATRFGILQQTAILRGVKASAEVLRMIAAHLPGDARQLFGALNRLQATSEALDKEITMQLAESALSDIFQATRRIVRLADISQAVSEVFDLDPEALQSTRKARTIAQPRMLAMWLAREMTRAAYSEIGEYFGDRTHSTVISAKNKVNRWIKDEETLHLASGPCTVKNLLHRVQVKLKRG